MLKQVASGVAIALIGTSVMPDQVQGVKLLGREITREQNQPVEANAGVNASVNTGIKSGAKKPLSRSRSLSPPPSPRRSRSLSPPRSRSLSPPRSPRRSRSSSPPRSPPLSPSPSPSPRRSRSSSPPRSRPLSPSPSPSPSPSIENKSKPKPLKKNSSGGSVGSEQNLGPSLNPDSADLEEGPQLNVDSPSNRRRGFASPNYTNLPGTAGRAENTITIEKPENTSGGKTNTPIQPTPKKDDSQKDDSQADQSFPDFEIKTSPQKIQKAEDALQDALTTIAVAKNEEILQAFNDEKKKSYNSGLNAIKEAELQVEVGDPSNPRNQQDSGLESFKKGDSFDTTVLHVNTRKDLSPAKQCKTGDVFISEPNVAKGQVWTFTYIGDSESPDLNEQGEHLASPMFKVQATEEHIQCPKRLGLDGAMNRLVADEDLILNTNYDSFYLDPVNINKKLFRIFTLANVGNNFDQPKQPVFLTTFNDGGIEKGKAVSKDKLVTGKSEWHFHGIPGEVANWLESERVFQQPKLS